MSHPLTSSKVLLILFLAKLLLLKVGNKAIYLESGNTVVHVEGSVGLLLNGKRVDVDVVIQDGSHLGNIHHVFPPL